jgi:MoxR-like ATPase
VNDSTHAQEGPATVAALANEIETEVARRVFGLGPVIEAIVAAVIAGKHVLLEGVPGLGKTLLMKTLSTALGCDFKRIQFTPDLLPADVLGGYVYDPREGSFHLRKGPIFAQVILADEINRAPAKTQSALLEVMQEAQVTIEGETIAVPEPFVVFATQNPLEHEGVYPLPQAQLDRFAMRIHIRYPEPEEEMKILGSHREPPSEPKAVADPARVLAARAAAEQVRISDEILRIILELATRTRQHAGVSLGASPRVGVDLVRLSRALALVRGRDHVIPDDLKHLFFHVTNHRIALSPQAELGGLSVDEVIGEALESTQLV